MKKHPLIYSLCFFSIFLINYLNSLNFDQSNYLYLSISNLSIIIETDFFDYNIFEKVWKPIISDIPLYITSFYIFVHHKNHFNQTNKATKRKENIYKIKNLKWAKVIISDLPENGYLPLMISSYGLNMYPPRIICYIDIRNYDYHKSNSSHFSELFKSPNENLLINNDYSNHQFQSVISQWITNSFVKHLNDPNLASIFGFKTEIQIPNENHKKVVGCDVVMVKEEIVRELLFYTKSSMDSPSSFLALSLIDDQKVYNSYDLISTEFVKKDDFDVVGSEVMSQINEEFQCPLKLNEEKVNFTFSIFIPCFKRNYFKQIMKTFSKQIAQPSYYVLIQNRHYISLDVDKKISKYLIANKRPIYKIWMVNFNSFFILPNLITSLLNTDFVFRFDDDHFPLYNNITNNVLNAAIKANLKQDSIIGHRASVLNIRIFAFRSFYHIFCRKNEVDYVASPYIFRPQQMKLSGRVRPFFLAGGEDFQLGLVSSIQCGTISLYMNFNIFDNSEDRMKHIYDREIQNYYKEHRFNELPDYFSHCVYAYYIQIGYKPKCWINFKLKENERINGSEYRHRPFF